MYAGSVMRTPSVLVLSVYPDEVVLDASEPFVASVQAVARQPRSGDTYAGPIHPLRSTDSRRGSATGVDALRTVPPSRVTDVVQSSTGASSGGGRGYSGAATTAAQAAALMRDIGEGVLGARFSLPLGDLTRLSAGRVAAEAVGASSAGKAVR